MGDLRWVISVEVESPRFVPRAVVWATLAISSAIQIADQQLNLRLTLYRHDAPRSAARAKPFILDPRAPRRPG